VCNINKLKKNKKFLFFVVLLIFISIASSQTFSYNTNLELDNLANEGYTAIVSDGVTAAEEQDLTGVLAINTHKSIYLENEEAFIGIAVLDDQGHMVCDADLVLTITDPGNKETILTTANGDIKVSDQCSVYGVTNLPDYYTNYQVNNVGNYLINLTAVTSNGIRSITDTIIVQQAVDFDVARDGATRIYPPVPYVMNFTIKANKDYTGPIVEYIPSSFAITPQNGLTITEMGDAKQLSWIKELTKVRCCIIISF